jgi:hypothetical protein
MAGDVPGGVRSGRLGVMTPPRWLDERGRPRPTRPCPKCGRVIPVNRWPAKAAAIQRRPYQVLSFVEWCGHQQEVVLVPDGDGMYSEIPVLGVAS